MEEVYGTYAEGPDVPGDTATAHIRRALSSVRFDQTDIGASLERWCRSFSERYVRLLASADTSHWVTAPHAAEALAAVERRALLTGNPPDVARARMDRLGLAAFFPRGQGAFGCERENRVELFALARARAGNWPAERTVAVGDTPIDISSAHEAGCLCIAVASGRYREDELGHADAVIADLSALDAALATLVK
jgi:phosphoglycolate phosphatase-like HAD superfamily hydrolase